MASTDFATPRFTCACGYSMDRCSYVDGGKTRPVAGDLSVCMACGRLYELDAQLTHRLFSKEEENKLPNDVAFQVAQVRLAIRAAQREDPDFPRPR